MAHKYVDGILITVLEMKRSPKRSSMPTSFYEMKLYVRVTTIWLTTTGVGFPGDVSKQFSIPSVSMTNRRRLTEIECLCFLRHLR